MTEQIGDQVSAFIDDELPEDEGAFLVRRFGRDASARGRAFRYMTIGCALRGELLSPDPAELRRRIANVLAGGPATVAAQPKRVAPRFMKPLAGVAVAASVAAAALYGVRFVNDAGIPAGAAAGLQAAQWVEPESYVVPPDPNRLAANAIIARPELTTYVWQHSAALSGFSRLSAQSNVVGGAESYVIDAEAIPGKVESASASTNRGAPAGADN